MKKVFSIREAVPSDSATILRFINLLAEYEKLAHEVVATEELIREEIFSSKSPVSVILAEVDGQAMGFALYFHNFSTFLGRKGIYLEDLFVLPEARGLGLGKGLLRKLAQIAVEHKCGRVDWSVLDRNSPAIEFYKSIGAFPLSEWTMYRLTGENLLRFASDESI